MAMGTVAEREVPFGYPDWNHPERIQQVYVRLLLPHQDNPRTTASLGRMERLVASIAKYGVKTPLKIRRDQDGNPVVIGGHRRLHAAGRAGCETVPCQLLERDMSPEDEHLEMLLDNLHREDMPPMDEAEFLEKVMKERGLPTQAALAQLLDIEPAYVSQSFSLLRLKSETAKKEVNAGRIPRSVGVDIARFDSSEKQERVAVMVATGKYIGKDVKRMLAESAPAKRSSHGGRQHYRTTERTFRVRGGSTEITVRDSRQILTDSQIREALREAEGQLQIDLV